MKKVISFSLFGNAEIYNKGMIQNAILAKDIYPDWIVRVYYSDTIPLYIIETLKNLNCELILCTHGTNNHAAPSMWRMYCFDDPEIQYWISRDADSRLSLREKHAVDQWIQSKKTCHIMREKGHTNAILAGMFGIDNTQFPKGQITTKMIDEWCDNPERGKYGNDEFFLSQSILPFIKTSCLVHDDFMHLQSPQNVFGLVTKFKVKNEDNFFVGCVVNVDETFMPHYQKLAAFPDCKM